MRAQESPAIVVFTRGRPLLVRRIVRYHHDYPGQLIVVDGSEAPVDGIRMPPGGEYLHRPGMSVHGRICEGINRVEAAACALSADDDYQVHSGLAACGRAISDDPRVACAAGTAVYFVPGVRSPAAAVADGAVERFLEMPRAGDPPGRFGTFISHGPQAFYACFRTAVARRVADFLVDLPDEDGLVGEQLWGPLASLFGETVLLDQLQLCRRRAHRDYTRYLAPFRRLDDVANWHGFGRFGGRLRALAVEAGADGIGADRVIEAWRDFAAATARGRRNWRRRRFPVHDRTRRILRNLASNFGVMIDPRAWVDPHARDMTRDRASRILLRSRAYPWSDVRARDEYERVIAFDAQAPARA